MGTRTLTGIEIFAEGTWNNIEFSSDDLDGMAGSFDTLKLSGRIPLKTGHSGSDPRDEETQYALGWITKVYRRGKKLLADAEIAESTAQLIDDGHLRHVSVEILCDVQAGTRVIPYVLDAVALLGVDPPAVGILKDLRTALSHASKFAHASRVSFSTSPTFKRPDTAARELTELRHQIAAEKVSTHRAMLTATIESAVATGTIPPRVREAFTRTYQLTDDKAVLRVTLADAVAFIKANAGQGVKTGVTSFIGDTSSVLASTDADIVAGDLVAKFIEEHPGTDPLVAMRKVFKANPEAAQEYARIVMRKTGR